MKRIRCAVLCVLLLAAASCRASTESAVEPVGEPTPTSATTKDAPDPPETDEDVAPTVEPAAAPTVAPSPEPTATPTEPTPTATPTPAPATIEELEALASIAEAECPADVASAQVTCSIATLPRDIEQPVPGESVQVFMAQVDNGDPNGVGPVVFLQGGPGVASTSQAPGFVGAVHDLLFIDHRGTGYSLPELDCPEVDELWERGLTDDPELRLPDGEAGEAFVEATYAACADRLRDEGIDFDDFNTTASAVDIELIRRLLGHEPWSIWGISYGTRLGLTVMRDHPEGVRAAVLDSIVPYEVDFFATIPENGLRSMRALDAACDATACSTAHGDFFDNLAALTRRLNDEPIVVTATRPGSGATFPFRVDGETLLNMVFTQLYSTRSLRSLPRQIARPDAGGVQEIVNLYVNRRDPQELDLSVGLYYTTWCREEFPFYDASIDDDLLLELLPLFGDAADEALSSDGIEPYCEAFAVEPAAPSENEPLRSDIPTLVFAGAFDPITPPSWSRLVADAFSNATYVEMADHGHGMSSGCPVSIRLAFLREPRAPLDTSCADATGGPQFE